MSKAYIARQPILNRNGKIFGYELFFRDHNGLMEEFPSNLTATARVMMNALNHMNFQDIKGSQERKLFINIDHTILKAGIVELLEPEHFILEILETTEIDDALVARINELKKRGYRFALDDFDCSAEMLQRFIPIIPLMEFIKIDVMHAKDNSVEVMAEKFKKYGITLLAEKVETKEEYLRYSRLGFELFQGYYFHMPEKLEGTLYNLTTSNEIRQQIQLISQNRRSGDIMKFFKQKPDVSFNLIRFLNSVSEMDEEISSIEHALTLMGKERLMRWLLTYFYSEQQSKQPCDKTLDAALARAINMEVLFEEERDKAYLTGLYSMLDHFFEEKKETLFEHVRIDVSIKEAIIEHKGPMGMALRRICCEETAEPPVMGAVQPVASMRSIIEGL